MNRRSIPSRRAVLSAVSAGVVGSIAGCLGGSQPPDDAVESLPTPTSGSSEASVTVAVFEDFACPHCRTFAVDVYPQLVAEYVEPGDVRYEHYDFPIPVDDRWSWEAAGAARAVQDTVGDGAFFEFSTRLFEDGWTGGSMEYSEALLRELAEAVDADPDTVVTAASEGRYRPVIESDKETGTERGVRGTPAVFVDETLLDSPDYPTIEAAIENRL